MSQERVKGILSLNLAYHKLYTNFLKIFSTQLLLQARD